MAYIGIAYMHIGELKFYDQFYLSINYIIVP